MKTTGLKLNLHDLTFENGLEDTGGAIFINQAYEVSLQSCRFVDNVANNAGGALSVEGTNTVTIHEGYFKNNSSYFGGAIHSNATQAVIVVEKSIFEDNSNISAGAVFYGNEISIRNSVIQNNNQGYDDSVIAGDPNSILDARYNDWGSVDGPGGTGALGSGDPIGLNVLYQPFIGLDGPCILLGDVVCTLSHEGDDKETTDNPISLKNGEKRLDETDIQLTTPQGILAFKRHYRQSQQNELGFMGLGWTHNHYRLLVEDGLSPNKITITMAGSQIFYYDDNADDLFEAAVGAVSVVQKTGSGYDLTATDESIYHFDTSGKLITHTLNTGDIWTYSYDGSGDLTQVSDGYGHSLKFAYYSGQSGGNTFKNGQLWRVGTHSSSDLTNNPQTPYIEFDYTDDGTGEALLTAVQDVRGYTWTYRYYGSEAGETDSKWINFMVERFSPSVDSNGDNTPDGAIQLEALAYTGNAGDDITRIVQNRGDSAIVRSLDFDRSNGVTSEEIENITLTHKFTNGVLVALEDEENNEHRKTPSSHFRPIYNQDANGNQQTMKWSTNSKNLEGVVDALGNETTFDYDSQDRLISTINAEGRSTQYIYGDANNPRQPTQIHLKTGAALINGDMEGSLGWQALGSPTSWAYGIKDGYVAKPVYFFYSLRPSWSGSPSNIETCSLNK